MRCLWDCSWNVRVGGIDRVVVDIDVIVEVMILEVSVKESCKIEEGGC